MHLAKNRTGHDDVNSIAAWYALQTRYQHEKAVSRVLSGKGFEVFLPLYAAVHLWKDRAKEVSLPLFPCYVFLRGGLDRQLQIVKTSGVRAFVGYGGRPAAIPPSEIDAIRQMLETTLRVEPHPFLRCGDWVRVQSGPLEGIEGILVRKKNLSRLVLSVELLEKSIAVEVDVSFVERLDKPKLAPCHLEPVPFKLREAIHDEPRQAKAMRLCGPGSLARNSWNGIRRGIG